LGCGVGLDFEKFFSSLVPLVFHHGHRSDVSRVPRCSFR
jgi:hypothetical protein